MIHPFSNVVEFVSNFAFLVVLYIRYNCRCCILTLKYSLMWAIVQFICTVFVFKYSISNDIFVFVVYGGIALNHELNESSHARCRREMTICSCPLPCASCHSYAVCVSRVSWQVRSYTNSVWLRELRLLTRWLSQ